MERNEIYVIHGSDYAAMTRRLLERMDLQGDIGNRDQLIAIKPNLVLDSHPSDGATTHPEIVEGVITYLHDHGFHRIQVMEGSWVGARTGPALEYSGHERSLPDHHYLCVEKFQGLDSQFRKAPLPHHGSA